MVVSGLPEKTDNHAVEIVEYGFDMFNAISLMANPSSGFIFLNILISFCIITNNKIFFKENQ